MKRFALAALAVGALACAAPLAHSQDAPPIKVTTRLNADGTRTDTQKNLEERTSESTTYDSKGKVTQRAVFTLDEQGHETEGVISNAKNQITARVTLRYDSLGNVIEEVDKNAAGVMKRRIVFKRDSQGHLTSVETYDEQGRRVGADMDSTQPVRVRPKKK